MKYNFKFLIFSIILLFASCKNNHTNSNLLKTNKILVNDYSTKIDSLIQTTKPRKFNGVISITKNGKVIYSKAFGYSDFENKTRISLQDNFRIQSNSKQITGVLVSKEVEKGNINLHIPIKNYLPELSASWADTVTVHQLLNMSAGIEALDKPLLFEPGTSFHYSNPAYGLLGRILKKVTKKEYSQLANDLFKEIGMDNTYCYQLNNGNKYLINGYQWIEDKFQKVNFHTLGFTNETWNDFVPTGGIISNVADLHIWDSKLHKGELLKSESYKNMTTSNVPDLFAALSDKQIYYGYGVDICDKPVKYIGHGGTGFGFVSIKFYVPEKDLDVIVLENLYNSNIPINYHFEKEIRKIVINSSLVK